MPIPWLAALKVIPWGDVIEHAPKVLAAARKMMEKTPPKAAEPPPTTIIDADLAPDRDWHVMERMLQETRQDHDRLRDSQAQLTEMVAELAEQNARLVSAVETLRIRTRLLMGAVASLAVVLAWFWWR